MTVRSLSMTEHRTTVPSSAKNWVMPSFLPMMPGCVFMGTSLLVASAWAVPEPGPGRTGLQAIQGGGSVTHNGGRASQIDPRGLQSWAQPPPQPQTAIAAAAKATAAERAARKHASPWQGRHSRRAAGALALLDCRQESLFAIHR